MEYGLGCAHCPYGHPITKIGSRGRVINLCLACTLAWFPGKDAAWFEERHSPFRDHVEFGLNNAHRRELARAPKPPKKGNRRVAA